MNAGITAWLLACVVFAGDSPAAPNQSQIRVSVPRSKTGEVDLAELVERLARATGLDIERPPGDLTLPLDGVAGTLSRKMLATTLGDQVAISVETNALVLLVEKAVTATALKPIWARRVGELADRAEREAKRRLQYGMHALKSYRPNDPTRPTVCLIHGVNSSSYGFVHLIPHLEQAGYGVVVYDFPYNRRLAESCRRFAGAWSDFRRETGERRPWAIVGHSMGSLLARDYVEGDGYAGDVATLILVAPVNQGSHLARTQTVLQLYKGLDALNGRPSDALAHLGDGLGEAASDMVPGSPFLKALNARPRRAGVAYHILAGDSGVLPPAARRQIEAQADAARKQVGVIGGLARLAVGDDLPGRLDEVTDGSGDGCVSVARTRLHGVTDHVVIHANHAELIRAPLLFKDPGPVACMSYLLKWLGAAFVP